MTMRSPPCFYPHQRHPHGRVPRGCGFPVVLCHGFPELAFSWRHQLPALSRAGFRASPRPARLRKDRQAGPPWRSTTSAIWPMTWWVCWTRWEWKKRSSAARLERACGLGRCRSSSPAGCRVIGINTPHRYFRRMGPDPVGWLREHFSPGNYRLAFLQKGVEDMLTPELLPRFLAGLFRARPITMAQYLTSPPASAQPGVRLHHGGVPLPEPGGCSFMSQEELDVYIEAFSHGGLTGPINWYRNLIRNAEIPGRHSRPDLRSLPDDLHPRRHLLPPELTEGMEQYVPDLERTRYPCCGHWTQAERPEELNRLMLEWLRRRFG